MRPSLEDRPKYVVMFRERSERNATLLSRVRKVKQAKGVQSRQGQVHLESKSGDRPMSTVFERLAVAVTDLDPDELEQIKNNEQVQQVVPNEIRSVPPIRPSAFVEGGFTAAFDDAPDPQSLSPRAAFLDGMAAAINAVRAFDGMPASVASPVRQALAAPRSKHVWGLTALGLGPAYARATGRGVKVAVLDTGINLNHPDFRGRFVLGENGNAHTLVLGETVDDGHGHGTHCYGIVGGPRQSTGGIRYGVAPDAEIFVGKVLDSQGFGGDDQILHGIDWAVDRGCQIISMSLGSRRVQGQPYSQLYEQVASLQPGVLIVAAAGNDSDRPHRTAPVSNPAACPSILAVAAVDRQLQVASFSNQEKDRIGQVDVSAPGVSIYSALGNDFALLDGTSMATPYVAGCLALCAELNPGVAGRPLWNLMQQRLRALPGSPLDYGRGLTQAP